VRSPRFICAALLRAIPPPRARTRFACGEANTIRQRRHAVQGSLRLSLWIVQSRSGCRFSPDDRVRYRPPNL